MNPKYKPGDIVIHQNCRWKVGKCPEESKDLDSEQKIWMTPLERYNIYFIPGQYYWTFWDSPDVQLYKRTTDKKSHLPKWW